MAAIEAPIDGAPEPMSNSELIAHCQRLTQELKRRQGAALVMVAPNEPTQSEVCAALFDVSQATQAALIANNCPGV